MAEEGPSREAAPATKKRKIGTAVKGLGVSDRFAVELMGTCAALGGRMSSPELWESLARMLKVTGGRCNAPNFESNFFFLYRSLNLGVTPLSHFFSLKPHPSSKL
jgi:hypothetical protein